MLHLLLLQGSGFLVILLVHQAVGFGRAEGSPRISGQDSALSLTLSQISRLMGHSSNLPGITSLLLHLTVLEKANFFSTNSLEVQAAKGTDR